MHAYTHKLHTHISLERATQLGSPRKKRGRSQPKKAINKGPEETVCLKP